jgi:hypothetical protein
MAHTRCMLDKQGYTHSNAHAPGHTRAHIHTDKYVIIIVFPLQQLLRERASMLRFTCIACLAYFYS